MKHCFRLLALVPVPCLLFALFAPAARADTTVLGTIARVSAAEGIVTVNAAAGPVTIAIQATTWITLDRVDASLANLRAGERVSAVVYPDAGGLSALLVDAEVVGRQTLLRGTLASLAGGARLALVDVQGGPKVTPMAVVDAATLVGRDGLPAAPADLQPGDRLTVAELLRPDGSALAIRIDSASPHDPRTVVVSGSVQSISGDRIVVRTWKKGVREIVDVDPRSAPRRNKRPASMGDFDRGDEVVAFGIRQPSGEVLAFTLTAQSPAMHVRGTITAVEASQGWITFVPVNGRATILQMYPSTVLQLNGQDADITDIDTGDVVEVRGEIQHEGLWGATSVEIVRPSKG